jgi:hypothetical protein
MLGDGYAETLRKVYKDVPDTVDFVMYWWHKAAELVRAGNVERLGLITTNSIRQVWQRKVIETQLNKKNPIRLIFAIPDHPWTDGGAAVRIAMTGAELDDLKVTKIAQLGNVFTEVEAEIPEEEAERVEINWRDVGQIFSNLQVGTNIAITSPLKSNYKLGSRGVQLIGTGFCLTTKEAKNLESNVVYSYLNGRDLLQTSRNALVIDLFGLKENEIIENYPKIYQWLYTHVKPEREQNNRETYRKNWWIFGEPRANLRPALKTIKRYIGLAE